MYRLSLLLPSAILLLSLPLLVSCGDEGGNTDRDTSGDADVPTGFGDVSGTVTAVDGGDVTGALIDIAGIEVTLDDTGTYQITDVPAGVQTVSAMLMGYQAFSTSITVVANETQTLDIVLQTSSTDNLPPEFVSFSIDPNPLAIGGTATATVVATDPDGDDISYAWEATGGFTVTANPDGATATVTAPAQPQVTGEITVTLSDPGGLTRSLAEPVSTNDNNVPTLSGLTALPQEAAPGDVIALSVAAADPDGDTLTFTWSVVDTEFVLTPAGASASLATPTALGRTTMVTVEVSDGRGGTAMDSIEVRTTPCTVPNTLDCDGDASNGCEAADSGLSALCAAESCNRIRASGASVGDGVYFITRGGAAPYEAYCDMTTDGGGWTLLGTVSGSDADQWNTDMGLWSDGNLVGAAAAPWVDYKAAAWVDFTLGNSDALIQRRFDGNVEGQVILDNACLGGATHFADLFATFDTAQACTAAEMTVLAGGTNGVASPDFAEGGLNGLGGVTTNGLCWNGEDTAFNTFKGRLVWTSTASDTNCSTGGHAGGIAVFENDAAQYENADITGTSWLLNTDYARTDVSIFVRDKIGITGVLSAGDPGRWDNGTFARWCNEYIRPPGGYAYTGSTGDGVYTIDPDGAAGPIPPTEVYCDMTSGNGGWTAIAANGDISTPETTDPMDCYPLISDDPMMGCGNATNLMEDFTLAGEVQAGLQFRRLLAVSYGDTGYNDKLAYFGIDFGSQAPLTEERTGGVRYNISGLTTNGRIRCTGNSIVHYTRAGTHNPSAGVALDKGTVFGHDSAPNMSVTTRKTFGFTDTSDRANGTATGVDDYQDGWSCSDDWSPKAVLGARMVVLVR